MTEQILPPGFADLEPFVGAWALKGQSARYGRMTQTDMSDLTAFYEQMLPRVAAALDHLDGFPLNAMPAPQQRLLDLVLTFAETAHPADFRWQSTSLEGVFPFERIKLFSASNAW